MFGTSLWEFFVVATACVGFPLLGAGAVVAIAMPLNAPKPDDQQS